MHKSRKQTAVRNYAQIILGRRQQQDITDRYGNVSKTETLCASCTLKNEECRCDCTREYLKK